jgi:hypothetical protein
MLKHYTEEYAPSVDNFEVIFVEKAFSIPVVSIWGNPLKITPYMIGDEDKPTTKQVVNYSFKCDALVESPSKKKYILEHKSAAQFNSKRSWLAMDEQCGSYPWAIQTVMPDVRVEGVLYNSLMKQAPKPLKQLKNGGFSQDKRQLTTYKLARKQLNDAGVLIEAYADYLEFLQDREARENPFFRREVVKRNQQELAKQEHMIKLEAMEMLKPDVLIYRNPGPFTCNFCPFFDPCVMKYEGGDYEFILQTLYRKKEEGIELDRARS